MGLFPDWFTGENTDYSRDFARILGSVADGRHETTLVETLSESDGPHICVVGGIHGGEPAGADAAGKIATALPSCGRTTVIPEANPAGLRNNQRDNTFGIDLNDEFTKDIANHHARALWEAINSLNPDVLIDLHSSRWPARMSDKSHSVGQCIYPAHDAMQTGRNAVDRVNSIMMDRSESQVYTTSWVDDHSEYCFSVGNPQGKEPEGPLVDKARWQAGMDSFLVEAARNGVPYDSRVDFLVESVKALAREYDMALYGV